MTPAQRAEKARQKKEEQDAKADKKKYEKELVPNILMTNLAASNETDEVILNSSSFNDSKQTVRDDIHSLTDNDRVAAPMKVAIAATVAKLAYPAWDTRKHQVGIGGLKSLRTTEHEYVAKNLHRLGLYRTATEGFLTRSFESKHPFTMEYPGAINPPASKHAFLRIVNRINEDSTPGVAETILRYFLYRLQESKKKVDGIIDEKLVTEKRTTLKEIQSVLTALFSGGAGLSATPTIVVHTAFSIVQPHMWPDIEMAPLKRHTASDSTSRAIGDIEAYRNGSPFLSVEIKHNIAIDSSMILTFAQKTLDVPMRFMLTTRKINTTYTDENILIGNVTEITLHYIHSILFAQPDAGMVFITRLRNALVESPDISPTNKIKISELFTKHLGSTFPE